MRRKIVFLATLLFIGGPTHASAQELVAECDMEFDGLPCTDGVYEGLCGEDGPNNCEDGETCYYPACKPQWCEGDLQEGDACKLGDLDGVCTNQCDRTECDSESVELGLEGNVWCLIPAPSNSAENSDDSCSATDAQPGALLPFAVLGLVGVYRRRRKSNH